VRRFSAIVGAALAVGVAATAPAATSKKPVALRLGDVVDVLDTRIACDATVGTVSLKGKRLVGCYVVDDRGAPAAGSYAPALAVDGEIVIVKVSAKATVVFRRTLASARSRAGRYLKATVGSRFALTGTDLSCGVTRGERGITASCFELTKGTRTANTYGFAIANRLVSILTVDAQHRPHTLYTRPEPK
jgi:hypothetical protein